MKHNKPAAAISVLTAAALVLSGCGKPHTSLSYANGSRVDCGGKQEITASGSTAQANAVKQFIDAFTKACNGQNLSYTANASGAGVADFLAGRTDFAGSDLPLSGDQYAVAKQRCGGADAWNLPVVFGPIGITYNLNAIDSLVLDAPTLARIFNGSITRWDDPAITALNASMPPENIHVVYRADPSGTTAHFQAYLQAASGGAWDKGTGKIFNGGVGSGAHGNIGTSAEVKNTEGAISYNELSFAMQEGLFAAQIKTPASRKSLRPVRIGTDSVGKTITNAKIIGKGNDLVLDTTSFYNPTQPDVYPIVMVTYEIVCSKYPNTDEGQAVKAFLQAAVGPGQADLDKNGYIPLPADFQSRVFSAVDAITSAPIANSG
ncbi:phosphate ABC transporter substrate-binding protein PstS [Mycobacterium montefiorense]|uniref:Phosphate-binding protein n=1 Tax=Mycobacterium montefiorense TaxID=154654 RepID=A0AA37UVS1_9MYCO|nr:phosphate ABC transporter substrate-binding protein PstS [Mycobacterium montefiorense]GBG36966.1 phosphate-binding protein PstS 3 [Mycobacterium montefiorense]GKU37872.1 phosphate-binding protein PstS 3 [Mycobacterium montefiorense]GKU42504.1 phosphate-binding protein PstS 3 [Mycobacterium montefiorense]GKU46292.1 phosphate-binding protein PstS 3 [Mycobacterium montefiorense]GKU51124.1 phosphate-binding protein PstS 3 [Mycobacterium montefiorense]